MDNNTSENKGDGGEDARNILLVCPLMSSPGKIAKTETIDDMHNRVEFEWTPEIRANITSVRKEYYPMVRGKCVSIFGNSFCRAGDIRDILETVEAADKELKAIHPSLGAVVRFLPLSVDSATRGEVYRTIVDAIRGRIYTELVERLRGLPNKVNMPERSRLAIIGLCDRLKAWNIVEDPEVTRTLDNIKTQIANNIVEPVLADLTKEMDALKERGAFLEV